MICLFIVGLVSFVVGFVVGIAVSIWLSGEAVDVPL